MSGATNLVHEGHWLRLVFSDGKRIKWARDVRPDGTVVTPDEKARSYRDRYAKRLARLARALEPLLLEIAAAQQGVLLAIDDPGFAGRRQRLDLTLAQNPKLCLEVALPSALRPDDHQRLLACARSARKSWGRG